MPHNMANVRNNNSLPGCPSLIHASAALNDVRALVDVEVQDILNQAYIRGPKMPEHVALKGHQHGVPVQAGVGMDVPLNLSRHGTLLLRLSHSIGFADRICGKHIVVLAALNSKGSKHSNRHV